LIDQGIQFLDAVMLCTADMAVPGHVLYLAFNMGFEPAQQDTGSDMQGVSDGGIQERL
jgi:hypothetical protein